ncbi:hypothetical protein HG533_06440 [Moraxella osloensis]|nr:hypothetical protein [Moraxella osloensis]MBW4018444.1 hypothetical protein [Moraxella osloensis]
MNETFSMESLADRIFFEKSKKYFQEVTSSYYSGNYRSAIVMLWSVVIFDLVLKLQSLKNSYNDASAISLLEEITKKQIQNPKSPDWELYLVEKVCENTNLIDYSEIEQLKFLQKQRHLSAHPVIKDDLEIYNPSKEIVKALTRSVLESVLIKPPLYTQKIIENILIDLSVNQAIFDKLSDMRRYMNNKYLLRLTDNVKSQLFKSFWKMVFILDNEQCERNRIVNTKFLCILIEDNIETIKQSITKDKDFYSNIQNDKKFLDLLSQVLNRNSILYPLLNEDLKMRIEHRANKDLVFCLKSYFAFNNASDYYAKLGELLDANNHVFLESRFWERLDEINETSEAENHFINLLIRYYARSYNYNSADHRFSLIKPYFDNFSEKQFHDFINEAETNNQTYHRGLSQEEYYNLKNKIIDKFPEFDFSSYKQFNRLVESHVDENNIDLDSSIIKQDEEDILF